VGDEGHQILVGDVARADHGSGRQAGGGRDRLELGDPRGRELADDRQLVVRLIAAVVGEGRHGGVHVFTPVVAADAGEVAAAEPVPGRDRRRRGRRPGHQGPLGMVDVAVDAVHPGRVDRGVANHVPPRRPADREQLIGPPHDPQALVVVASAPGPGEVAVGKQERHEVVHDPQPPRLPLPQPVG
jgi:hypothetical protein